MSGERKEKTDIFGQFKVKENLLVEKYKTLYTPNRKEFALSVKKSPDSHYFFKLYDNKSIKDKLILEALESI